MPAIGSTKCCICGRLFLPTPRQRNDAKKKGVKFYCHSPCSGTPMYGKSLRERLEAYLDKSNDCWIWTAGTTRNGYGTMRISTHGRRRQEGAHRIAWLVFRGPIPDGLIVCHKCDNPPCCNPDHLFLGTYQDNTLDCVAKGRKNPPRGERSGKAILNEAQVREIRRLHSEDGLSQKSIAEKFNIASHHVGLIVRRMRWNHLL